MAHSPSQNPRGRILLVDDNSLGLVARRSVLEELGHQVQTAGNAAEALELCGKHGFDVVVTDYKMPRLDGLQLAKMLRAERPGLPVLIMSGRMSDPAALQHSGFPMLPKPFTINGFMSGLEHCLEK